MAHAIWSGSINFGLVTIPVKLFTAVRAAADLHFNLLHNADRGRIKNERVCSECGKKVAWEDIIRGYEYEKGQYVEVTDEDFKRAAVEATQSVQIIQFVDAAEIDPIYYDVAYYLEPEKKARHAYALLRESLRTSQKVGIARVVLRTREHVAALKPKGDALVIELLHWADEIVDATTLALPPEDDLPAPEMKMAAMLIESMTAAWHPEDHRDTYREALETTIAAKARGEERPRARGKALPSENVLDLMDVLKKSLEASKAAPPPSRGPAKAGPKGTRAAKKHHAA